MRMGDQNPILLAVRQVFPNRTPYRQREIHEQLTAAYSQPHRYYHTTKHLTEMLELTDRFVLKNKPAFLAALLFHDVVYEPERYAPDYAGLSNEQESALICEQVLRANGVNEQIIARAKELILMTEKHKAPEDDEEALLFVDIDMAGLSWTECGLTGPFRNPHQSGDYHMPGHWESSAMTALRQAA